MQYVYAVYESTYDFAEVRDHLLAVYALEDDADFAVLELEEANEDEHTDYRVDRLEVK